MSKTILLADDSSTIRKIVVLTFSGTDVRVDAVDSGAAALRRLEQSRPDLILADVVMPAPNGYELCRQVKSGAGAVPVILLSSAFEPYDERLAADCGADRHLVKPFEPGALKDAVRELLEAVPRAGIEPASAAETLDERLVDLVAKAVVRRLSEQVVREIAREVLPDLTDSILRERIRQLETEDP